MGDRDEFFVTRYSLGRNTFARWPQETGSTARRAPKKSSRDTTSSILATEDPGGRSSSAIKWSPPRSTSWCCPQKLPKVVVNAIAARRDHHRRWCPYCLLSIAFLTCLVVALARIQTVSDEAAKVSRSVRAAGDPTKTDCRTGSAPVRKRNRLERVLRFGGRRRALC